MRHKLSKDQEQEVCRRYVSGESTKNLGLHFGVDSKTIYDYLRRGSVVVRSAADSLRLTTKLRFSETQKEEIVCRYQSGEGLVRLQKTFHTSWKVIKKILESKGVRPRDRISSLKIALSKTHDVTHPLWKGVGEFSGTYLAQIRRGAVQRGFSWYLEPQFLWDLFLHQERKCALTGVFLFTCANGNMTASLDRIDPNKGYLPENVQWLDKQVNMIKNKMPEPDFVSLCRRVADHSRGLLTVPSNNPDNRPRQQLTP